MKGEGKRYEGGAVGGGRVPENMTKIRQSDRRRGRDELAAVVSCFPLRRTESMLKLSQ